MASLLWYCFLASISAAYTLPIPLVGQTSLDRQCDTLWLLGGWCEYFGHVVVWPVELCMYHYQISFLHQSLQGIFPLFLSTFRNQPQIQIYIQTQTKMLIYCKSCHLKLSNTQTASLAQTAELTLNEWLSGCCLLHRCLMPQTRHVREEPSFLVLPRRRATRQVPILRISWT